MHFIRRWLSSSLKWLVRKFVLFSIPKSTERLIIFLTPGFDWRCGGVRAIVFHSLETRRISNVHGAKVVLATLPGDPWLLKYTWFKNKNFLVPFEEVAQRYSNLNWLMIHVPEYAVNKLIAAISPEQQIFLSRITNVHFNVMVQNIDQIEGQQISDLQLLGKVTCTTSHEAYCSEMYRKKIGFPLHPLLGYVDPGKYSIMSYQQKEDLLLVSPDPHPLKEQILAKIQKAYVNMRIQIISGISYKEYKRLISRAKWSLTFGEGLDGYFAEPIQSGGIGFAVYNDRFFTPEYLVLENIYQSWEEFENNIVCDLERLNNPQAYNNCWSKSYDRLIRYDANSYHENLRRFYIGDYVFP